MGRAATEIWSDDFDGSDLNARWTREGIGLATVDGDSYLTPVSFTGTSEYLWFGPYIQTEIPVSGYFDIESVIECVAVCEDFNLGRAEIRLLDAYGDQIYAFGWGDQSETNNKASIYLHGSSDSDIVYTTGDDFAYSIFMNKPVRLVRNETGLYLFIEGELKHTAEAETSTIKYLDVGFLRYKEYPTYCTPEIIGFDSVNVSLSLAELPDAPTGLSCAGDDSQATLSWSTPSDGGSQIIGYRIYRGTSQSDMQLLTSIGDSTSFDDAGLTNGQEYFYAVSAVNDVGEGSYSDTTSVVPVGVPDAPVNIQTIAGYDYVVLSWNPPTDDGGSTLTVYNIHRGPDAGNMAFIGTTTSTEHNDTDLPASQTFYYAVSANNSVGEGDISEIAKATLGAAPSIPTEPRNILAIPGDGKVTLNWESPISNGNSPILNYIIYRGVNTSGLAPLITIGPSLSHIDIGLINDHEIVYKVSAVNRVGEGPMSASISATPFRPLPPGAPIDFVATPFNAQILLQWAEPEDDGGLDITGYKIYRGDDASNMSFLTGLGSILNFMDSGVKNGKTYFYHVSCVNPAGEGQMSNIVNCTPIGPGDINNGGELPNSESGWSLNNSIITVAILAVATVGLFFYMRKPLKPDSDD